MRFKKVAVMVMAVSLFMTSFTAGSSYASANETADTQIEGMILKSENVNIEETTVVQSVATSSSISDKSDTKASNKKTTKAKKTTKKRKKKKYSKSDLRLMASIINCEAGSEPYQGKVAVGIVVMNRVSSKSFPNSIREVLFIRKDSFRR
ncbi:MAG: cell wall hydrolase [Butyribacter sp.]